VADAPVLSLVVPAYEEAARLPRSLAAAVAYLERSGLDYEIVVVDDGSRDDTAQVARRTLAALGARRSQVIRLEPNRGKGAAVREGMLRANGERILFSDADLSTPIEEEARLRAELDAGADVAIGSRAVPGARITLSQGWLRQSAGRGVNRILRLLGLTDSMDTQCGFKMFRREAARALFSQARIDRFLFDVEVLFLARRWRLRVAEVPVEWRNDPDSRVHVLRDLPRVVRDVARIRFGRYPLEREPKSGGAS
jgi:dolichyl-phosphate beta-glucosyltransferase